MTAIQTPGTGDHRTAKAWWCIWPAASPRNTGTRRSCGRGCRWPVMCARKGVAAGYPSLARAAKATVHRILTQQALRPDKVTYYLERRDPAFEAKMREVLLVYQEVMLQNQARWASETPLTMITVSVR